MGRRVLIWVLIAIIQIALACKNCVTLTKAQKAMFRAHSTLCLAQSHANEQQVAALVAGDATDSPQLRRHVYCVLRSCKLIGKDGRPLKSGGWVKRTDAKSPLCSDPSVPQSPEDAAWRLFLCGEQKDSHAQHDNMTYSRAI